MYTELVHDNVLSEPSFNFRNENKFIPIYIIVYYGLCVYAAINWMLVKFVVSLNHTLRKWLASILNIIYNFYKKRVETKFFVNKLDEAQTVVFGLDKNYFTAAAIFTFVHMATSWLYILSHVAARRTLCFV